MNPANPIATSYFDSDKDYIALTISFKDQDLQDLRPIYQLWRISHIFDILKNSTKYNMYIEFQVNNTIHLHGILQITNKVKYHKETIPLIKSYGYIKVKHVFDLQKWIEYCTKDYHNIIKIFPEVQFPITKENKYLTSRTFKSYKNKINVYIKMRNEYAKKIDPDTLCEFDEVIIRNYDKRIQENEEIIKQLQNQT